MTDDTPRDPLAAAQIAVLRHGLEVLHSPHFYWGCNRQNCSGQAALDLLDRLDATRPSGDEALRATVADVVYELRNRKPSITDADIADVLERAALATPSSTPDVEAKS